MASHIEKTIGLKGVKVGLLYECMPKEDFARPERIAAFVKWMPIPLVAPRPLDEAISSAGGVTLEALDEKLCCARCREYFAQAKCWTGKRRRAVTW